MLMQWLVGEFSFLGMHFQNWMPVAAGIVALYIVYLSARMRT